MRRPRLLVALIVAVGIAGTVVALRGREDNTQFVAQQQSLVPVGAPALERLLATTSDPRPGYGGRALDVRCGSSASGALRNPWSCVVRYPRLPRVRFAVTVHADRSIFGAGLPEGQRVGTALTVTGCCVGAP